MLITSEGREVFPENILPRTQRARESVRRHHSCLENEYILRLIDTIKTKNTTYLAFEYAKYDLLTYCKKFDFSSHVIKKVAIGILKGLKYLHENGLFHGSLEPTQVRATPRGCIKLCGVMRAECIHDYHPNMDSLLYIAPELRNSAATTVRSLHETTAADVYSCGALLSTLVRMNERSPLRNQPATAAAGAITTTTTVASPNATFAIDTRLSDLIEWMTEDHPQERPTCDMALNYLCFEDHVSLS